MHEPLRHELKATFDNWGLSALQVGAHPGVTIALRHVVLCPLAGYMLVAREVT